MGATLVGGHTIEGSETTIGFTMLANQGTGKPRTKSLLRSGDVLLLTKPLGTGVLLAAHMLADCKSEWMDPVLSSMLLSNQAAASLIEEFGLSTARYDRLTTHLGFEVPASHWLVPYAEYTLGIPFLVELTRRSEDSNDKHNPTASRWSIEGRRRCRGFRF